MRKSYIDKNDLLKWEELKQEMFKSAIRLIHKIIKTEKPREIIKKAKTAKVEELLQDIPEKSSQERIIQEKPNSQKLQALQHHSRRAENGKLQKIQKTIEEISLQ